MKETHYPPSGPVRVTLAVLVGAVVIGLWLSALNPGACDSVMRRGGQFIETTFPDPQGQP